ncbi:MAG: transcriptional regulator, partial [Oscillospiraceae bacterium]
LNGYIQNKETAKALAHYTKISELFYSELGISVSENIKELYKEIVHSVNKVEMDISIINDNLQEAYCENGAYFCDYEVFKNIYRVQARSILRTEKAIQLALITLNHRPSVSEPKLNTKFVMGKLKKTILQSLRKGDTVAAYSPVQFVILLPLTSPENCQDVTTRIQENFKRVHRKTNVTITVTSRSVTPNESLI